VAPECGITVLEKAYDWALLGYNPRFSTAPAGGVEKPGGPARLPGKGRSCIFRPVNDFSGRPASMGTIWKGAISFGLVNIPVRVESATKDTAPKFRMLDGKDNSPIKTLRVRQVDEAPVEYKALVKGYEYEPGHYVIMDEDDFKQVALQVTRTIDILDFVDESEIDSRFYDKPYYLAVQPGGEKAYALLRQAMRETGKVAVAKTVFRNREHLAAVKVVGEVLVLDLMRFNEELVPLDHVDTPKEEGLTEKEVEMAHQLIGQLSTGFDPESYADEYNEKLLERIRAKIEGREIAKIEVEEAVQTEVVDLVARLKESIERAEQQRQADAKPQAVEGTG
jgi:DNA end-binding protein Ku